ncbi:YfbM family protein [Flavobacterium sp. NPDC079362]|nr:YfbM family protein [Flavobacterium azizsancarii]
MIANLLRVTPTELKTYLNDSTLLEERIYSPDADKDFNLKDIDKAWDAIIFLLTGDNIQNANNPLVQVLFSGQIIDEGQDLGYGPGHYLTPKQVKELNSKISVFTTEELKQRYNPEKMTEIDVYPSIWDSETFEYVDFYFKRLQHVYAEAEKNGQAIITFLS